MRAETPLWTAARSPFPSLASRVETQVAVIGGGPSGLAAALTLREHGVEVALLEAGRFGLEGSARGEGMALPGLAEHYATILEGLGREQARAWWRLAGEGCQRLLGWLQAFQIPEWEKGGVLLAAAVGAEQEEMLRGARALVEDGFEARMMGPAAATNYVPIDAVEGATYLPGAVCLNPAQTTYHLARGLAERGGQVFEESPVRQIQRRGDGLELSVSPCLDTQGVEVAGVVRCEVAVVAAGFGVGPLLRLDQVFPLRGQILTTSRVREGPRGVTPAVSCNRGHELYRRIPGGGMLASGINPASGWKEKTSDLVADETFGGVLFQLTKGRFPEVARAEMERLWPVIHTYTADGLPLLGPLPGRSRLHLLLGFANRSWGLGVGAGAALGARLAGEQAELPATAAARRLLG